MTDRKQLGKVLSSFDHLAIAVSGGVDSLTLAHAAQQIVNKVEMMHATSPAVPPAATTRVREMADKAGWRLFVLEAGEFADADYLKNPLNRCYFCKSNLYNRIRAATSAPIASGTNLDDLGDYRPGLAAAKERDVVHPFVEAGIDKSGVRALARSFGLDSIAALPAQPCLASRIETGIAINADDLAFVDHVEREIAKIAGPGDHRCRIKRQGFEVQLSAEAFHLADIIRNLAEELGSKDGRQLVGIEPYRKGSAFLVPGTS